MRDAPRRRLLARIARRFTEPLVAILLVAAAISGFTGDLASFGIIAVVIALSITLDVVQEQRAELAADALKRSVAIRADVLRDSTGVSVPVEQVVPGDVVELRAGDLVPADGVLIESRDLHVNEALLTGGPLPADKRAGVCSAKVPAEAFNALFAATSVVSGACTMLVIATGVRHVVEKLKIPARGMLTGAEIAELNEPALEARVEDIDLFARVSPDQKTRIIRALQARGHTVGFMGDGVNDAPAIRAAEVGLSVEGATDVARSAADMILLAQDLGVVADGVEEGRRTFANILKYVRMGTSSNFGNMLSMALASVALPFLPLLPVQILLNNLIYDLSELGILFDRVDQREVALPQAWNMGAVLRFTLIMGALSSAFDLATFGVLLGVFLPRLRRSRRRGSPNQQQRKYW